jgi:ATP-dependent Clp protease protease subunit
MYLNKEDKDIPIEERRPIKLLLYSYGGDGQACFSLLDVIGLSKTPIHTINMGVAMSAGLLILLAGHKRFCLKNSTALAHSGSGGASGTFEQTEAQMKDYKRFVDTMRNYIIERTNIDTKTLNKYKTKEWYLYAEDQVKYGIVNKIIDDIDEIL